MSARVHRQSTKTRATELYFKIEKHFAMGGSSPSLREINRMLGSTSSATAQMYVKILERWGLIKRIKGTKRTITLAQTNYPPIEYRKNVMRSNDHASS